MHYCCQCGQEIPRREKYCQNCGNQVEYLCALPPVQLEPQPRRKVDSATSMTKWILLYFFVIACSFGVSYIYFSSSGFQSWFTVTKPSAPIASSDSAKPVQTAASGTALKNVYNQLSVALQKTVALMDEAKKSNVAGDPIRTAVNYRSVHRKSDVILGQLTISPDIALEVSSVLAPLKESISLLSKSTAIMADYLEGKLSLSPPNPDWVARSQEYSVQSQVLLKDAQKALVTLRHKLD